MRLLAKNRIGIDCSADMVWQATIDVESWPRWTPTVIAAVRLDVGSFGPGSEVRLKQPRQAETVWRVTDFEPGLRFSWETRVNGIAMRAGHTINKTPQGSESILTVHVSGVLAVILWPFLKRAALKSIALENRSLKERCEAVARPGRI